MSPFSLYFLVFGLLTVVGGFMGFMKGSTISLVAGGLAGALLIAGALMLPTSGRPALIGLGIVSLALAGKFVPPFIKTMSFMPAGIMSILSVIGLGLVAWALFSPAK